MEILRLAQPLDQCHVTSAFGRRVSPVTHTPEVHPGVDFRAPEGTDVRAAADGIVIRSYLSVRGPPHPVTGLPSWRAYGERICIRHGDGWETSYAHLKERLVKEGDVVEAGQLIARSGSTGDSTGPHLHFELRIGGRPVDPMPYLTLQGIL